MNPSRLALGLAVALGLAGSAHAVPLVFSGTAGGATTAFDGFRAAIGGGSRITWDGVRLDGTDVNPATRVIVPGSTVAIPVDRFRAAGALFADPYAVAGDGFAAVNPATAGAFPAFSPSNTFVMFDDTAGSFDDRFIEQSFVLPGTATAAGTRGFGAIFVGVEEAGSSIEYFGRDAGGGRISLGRFAVPVGSGPGDTQFLGVLFDAAVIADVVLTVGTHALFSFDGSTLQSFGPQTGAGVDLAVTDDFAFATPQALVTVPEPPPLALGFAALGAALCLRRIRGA